MYAFFPSLLRFCRTVARLLFLALSFWVFLALFIRMLFRVATDFGMLPEFPAHHLLYRLGLHPQPPTHYFYINLVLDVARNNH